MPDPILVPPVPTVMQGEKPTLAPETAETRETTRNILDIFDRVAPEKFVKSPPKTPEEPVKPTPERVTRPEERKVERPVEPEKPVTAHEPGEKPPDHKLPSFLEKALTSEEVKPPTAVPTEIPSDQDWPEEMPQVQTSEEQKANYKKWRSSYNELKKELAAAKAAPKTEVNNEKVAYLEKENGAMREQLSRLGVEQHREFQQKIIQPMRAAWGEAAKIVKEVGGNPEDLAKALNLTGKAQFEALDDVLRELPESAKLEVGNAVSQYRRLDEARRAALDKKNLPQTVEALKKRDMEAQLTFLSRQKEQMKSMFDQAVSKLRDEAGVEVLQRSNDPDAKWWNDQADQIESVGRAVFIDNTDLGKMAYACVMAPMADVYRKLWLRERQERVKSEQIVRDKFGSEPMISESGGNVRNGEPDIREDLKKPFADVFIRTLHRQSNR